MGWETTWRRLLLTAYYTTISLQLYPVPAYYRLGTNRLLQHSVV